MPRPLIDACAAVLPIAVKFSGALVALRQTFVRRCHGGLGSSRACGVLAIQNMTAGQSALEPLSFGGVITVVARGLLGYRLFSRPALGAGLVAFRQTFVRRCHGGLGSPGLPGIGNSAASF